MSTARFVGSPIVWLRSLVARSAMFSLGWFVLTEGNVQDLWIGVVVILLALLTSYRILAPGSLSSLRVVGLLRFTGYFLVQSLRGGVDVAWRALHPSMPLKPGLIEVALVLPGEGPRVLLAWTVSLLPGTASVRLDEQRLVVHVLCDDGSAEREIQELEQKVEGLSRS